MNIHHYHYLPLLPPPGCACDTHAFTTTAVLHSADNGHAQLRGYGSQAICWVSGRRDSSCRNSWPRSVTCRLNLSHLLQRGNMGGSLRYQRIFALYIIDVIVVSLWTCAAHTFHYGHSRAAFARRLFMTPAPTWHARKRNALASSLYFGFTRAAFWVPSALHAAGRVYPPHPPAYLPPHAHCTRFYRTRFARRAGWWMICQSAPDSADYVRMPHAAPLPRLMDWMSLVCAILDLPFPLTHPTYTRTPATTAHAFTIHCAPSRRTALTLTHFCERVLRVATRATAQNHLRGRDIPPGRTARWRRLYPPSLPATRTCTCTRALPTGRTPFPSLLSRLPLPTRARTSTWLTQHGFNACAL